MLGAALAASPLASAQPPPDLGDQAALYLSASCQADLLARVGRSLLNAGQRGILGASAPGAASFQRTSAGVGAAQLYYEPIDSISRTLYEQLGGRMLRHDPRQAGRIHHLVLSGWVWQEFEQWLGRLGYSGRNVADVLTSYYVGSWEIVNQTVAGPAQWRAVRSQIGIALAYSPEVLLMSDIEKQRSSQTLGIVTAITNANRQNLQVEGDQVGLIALQLAVHESLLAQGIDLKRLRIGNRGFVAN